MNDFDPGPGWRRVRADEYPETGLIRWTPDNPTDPEVYWVREEPLPTEPGWYVAFESLNNGGPVVVELLASPAGQWVDASDRQYLDPDLNIRPLGPLTRLEPRAVTATAVLDRIQQIQGRTAVMAPVYDVVAREFGVES